MALRFTLLALLFAFGCSVALATATTVQQVTAANHSTLPHCVVQRCCRVVLGRK